MLPLQWRLLPSWEMISRGCFSTIWIGPLLTWSSDGWELLLLQRFTCCGFTMCRDFTLYHMVLGFTSWIYWLGFCHLRLIQSLKSWMGLLCQQKAQMSSGHLCAAFLSLSSGNLRIPCEDYFCEWFHFFCCINYLESMILKWFLADSQLVYDWRPKSSNNLSLSNYTILGSGLERRNASSFY